MRLRIATLIAVACSAALPRTATTKTPTKACPSPRASAVGSIAPTSSSLIHAMRTVAPARTAVARPVLQASPWAPSSPPLPAKSWACVRSENSRFSAYTPSSTIEIQTLREPVAGASEPSAER